MHIAAIKPSQPALETSTGEDSLTAPFPPTGTYRRHVAAAQPAPEASEPARSAASIAPKIANVHDFVNEMAPGTWLCFQSDGEPVNARLFWISPLRTLYIFTSRAHSHAFVVTPEELARELSSGTASLVLEPVPMFDRAVSAALDTLAAKKTASGQAEPALN